MVAVFYTGVYIMYARGSENLVRSGPLLVLDIDLTRPVPYTVGYVFVFVRIVFYDAVVFFLFSILFQ